MFCENLEELLNYIQNQILDENDDCMSLSFDKDSALLFVFEQEIPILISFQDVYDFGAESKQPEKRLCAELCAELLNTNIGQGYLEQLNSICKLIEDNNHIFKKLFKKGE